VHRNKPTGEGKKMSTGTEFAKMVRKNFGIGATTRTYRRGLNMKNEILEAIANSNSYPGYYSEVKSELFRAAYPILNAYSKHVSGGRVDPMVAYEIEMMSPFKFAGFLGEMIDAGITNNFEGEIFFQNMRQSVAA
jgi:hypothetical protein